VGEREWMSMELFMLFQRSFTRLLEGAEVVERQRLSWSEQTCQYAAKAGHLEVLKWARENGCPWGKETCEAAAAGGNFEVLKWARMKGCPWDSNTSKAAARGGDLELLNWALKNGCPWNDRDALPDAPPHVQRWAMENGYGTSFKLTSSLGNPVVQDSNDFFELLRLPSNFHRLSLEPILR